MRTGSTPGGPWCGSTGCSRRSFSTIGGSAKRFVRGYDLAITIGALAIVGHLVLTAALLPDPASFRLRDAYMSITIVLFGVGVFLRFAAALATAVPCALAIFVVVAMAAAAVMYFGTAVFRLRPGLALVAVTPYVAFDQVLFLDGFAAGRVDRQVLILYSFSLWILLAMLGDGHRIEERGLVDVKGKGEMRTFWLERS